jgi:hypothetical protein
VDGGEEGVRRPGIEEERRQGVDGGGEAAGRVGVEAQAGSRLHPAFRGAARHRPPGPLDLVRGREVEPPHLVELQQERVPQSRGSLGVESPGEQGEDAAAEPFVPGEALGIDELERQEGEEVVVGPRAPAGERAPPFAGEGDEIVPRPFRHRRVRGGQGPFESRGVRGGGGQAEEPQGQDAEGSRNGGSHGRGGENRPGRACI